MAVCYALSHCPYPLSVHCSYNQVGSNLTEIWSHEDRLGNCDSFLSGRAVVLAVCDCYLHTNIVIILTHWGMRQCRSQAAIIYLKIWRDNCFPSVLCRLRNFYEANRCIGPLDISYYLKVIKDFNIVRVLMCWQINSNFARKACAFLVRHHTLLFCLNNPLQCLDSNNPFVYSKSPQIWKNVFFFENLYSKVNNIPCFLFTTSSFFSFFVFGIRRKLIF